MEHFKEFFVAIIFWVSLLLFAYFKAPKTKQEPGKKGEWYYFERFVYYSGIRFVWEKFCPTEKNKFPTGFIWLVGLYFAAYAFTFQRYESLLDKVEFRYNTFTSQIAGGAKLSHGRLMAILTDKIPVKPDIYSPLSIYRSFAYDRYTTSYFETRVNNLNQTYKSASEFRQGVLLQWGRKLQLADFYKAQLQSVILANTHLEEAYFGQANLKEANFAFAQLQDTDFSQAQLQGADFKFAKLKGTSFFKAHLEGADFLNVQYLTAEQLIKAQNIRGLKYCPGYIIDKIKEYGCGEMLSKSPDEWSYELQERRRNLMKQWADELYRSTISR